MLTTDQAIEKLVSRRGWYKDSGLKGTTARVYKKRFLENKLELESRIRLLEVCGYRIVRQMRWENRNNSEKIKMDLFRKLRREKAFWYINNSSREISDKVLIEKALMYLDIGDIDTLFTIFPKKMIKDIWKELIVPQGPAYHKVNVLYAFLYFDIAHPERYIRDSLRKRLTSLQ
ncbi:MAG: hypothetical protein MUF36_06130 [Bacteroidales bacterium]|jgi:hypothetical protein|nr:hypothetical protein [Bacteroidales bacterium]